MTVGNNLTVTGTSIISGNETVTGTLAMGSSFKRNRIINGNMLIDQRNAGAAFGTSINGYSLDRWQTLQTVTGKLNGGQNYNSVTPPAGFNKYLGVQSQSAYTVLASDNFSFQQCVEGFNWADMGYGTASAKTSTLSFWVYSSLTGTFGGAFRGYDGVSVFRSYPFTYSIPSANTWTYITVTLPGDTTASAAWSSAQSTANGYGIILSFSLGTGSTGSGTAGSWSTANYVSATGATSVVGTSGATFYITGVQLEVGTKATPYEMQIYSDQLAQCQRYYASLINGNTTFSGNITNGVSYYAQYILPVTMRTTPTAVGTDAGASGFGGVGSLTPRGPNVITEGRTSNTSGSGYFGSNITASAEL